METEPSKQYTQGWKDILKKWLLRAALAGAVMSPMGCTAPSDNDAGQKNRPAAGVQDAGADHIVDLPQKFSVPLYKTPEAKPEAETKEPETREDRRDERNNIYEELLSKFKDGMGTSKYDRYNLEKGMSNQNVINIIRQLFKQDGYRTYCNSRQFSRAEYGFDVADLMKDRAAEFTHGKVDMDTIADVSGKDYDCRRNLRKTPSKEEIRRTVTQLARDAVSTSLGDALKDGMKCMDVDISLEKMAKEVGSTDQEIRSLLGNLDKTYNAALVLGGAVQRPLDKRNEMYSAVKGLNKTLPVLFSSYGAQLDDYQKRLAGMSKTVEECVAPDAETKAEYTKRLGARVKTLDAQVSKLETELSPAKLKEYQLMLGATQTPSEVKNAVRDIVKEKVIEYDSKRNLLDDEAKDLQHKIQDAKQSGPEASVIIDADYQSEMDRYSRSQSGEFFTAETKASQCLADDGLASVVIDEDYLREAEPSIIIDDAYAEEVKRYTSSDLA